MKIQCSCGAKYDFDITPGMAQNPVQFVCPACGLDASDFVNDLIRQELGQAGVAASGAVAAEGDQAEAAAPQQCSKHPGELVVGKCYLCSKPICPKCMELFGYLCSPLCKSMADAQGIQIPVYGRQQSVVQARFWRKMGWLAAVVGVAALGALGVWFWYAWFGSVPKTVYSVRFVEPAYSGQSWVCGQDQIVFLHGDTLARHDMKQRKEIWSRRLLQREEIEAAVACELKSLQAMVDQAAREGREDLPRIPSRETLTKRIERAAAAALELHVLGQNIWVASPGNLVRYDWDTGSPVKEIPLKAGFGGRLQRGDELLLAGTGFGAAEVMRVNLATGELRASEIGGPAAARNLVNTAAGTAEIVAGGDSGGLPMAGLPTGLPGRDAGKAMDPAKVAEQAQHLSLPERIALPALLAGNMNQERALAEMEDQPRRKTLPATAKPQPRESFSLVPGADGFVAMSVRLVESRVVARSAMKAAPAKPALDGGLTGAKSVEAANEILNDMQRSRGGDVVYEDESRYAVTIRQPDAAVGGGWSGELSGQPMLFPLKTVNVLAANKRIFVLDKENRQLWQAGLNFNMPRRQAALGEEFAPYGRGPCVERGNLLYVFDEGVLTAFDLATGNVLWRLPSVGIAGLFFDEKGMAYVNTTTASPESIKYSRQIDITQKTSSAILKIDPVTGKTLWNAHPGGLVNYVSGDFVYVVESYSSPEEEEENPYHPQTGFETLSYLRIKRINPRNGREIWEHFQQRAPLDVQFDRNTIRLVFRKEVQVLSFVAF